MCIIYIHVHSINIRSDSRRTGPCIVADIRHLCALSVRGLDIAVGRDTCRCAADYIDCIALQVDASPVIGSVNFRVVYLFVEHGSVRDVMGVQEPVNSFLSVFLGNPSANNRVSQVLRRL